MKIFGSEGSVKGLDSLMSQFAKSDWLAIYQGQERMLMTSILPNADVETLRRIELNILAIVKHPVNPYTTILTYDNGEDTNFDTITLIEKDDSIKYS